MESGKMNSFTKESAHSLYLAKQKLADIQSRLSSFQDALLNGTSPEGTIARTQALGLVTEKIETIKEAL